MLKLPKLAALRGPLEVLSYVGGLISLILIATQLRGDAADRRVSKTMEFVARFNDEPISGYRAALLVPWMENRATLATANALGGLNDENAYAMVDILLADYRRRHPDHDFGIALHEVADFFDQLDICTREGVCDAVVARQYFDPYTTQLRCLYGPLVERQGTDLGTPRLGAAILRKSPDERC